MPIPPWPNTPSMTKPGTSGSASADKVGPGCTWTGAVAAGTVVGPAAAGGVGGWSMVGPSWGIDSGMVDFLLPGRVRQPRTLTETDPGRRRLSHVAARMQGHAWPHLPSLHSSR